MVETTQEVKVPAMNLYHQSSGNSRQTLAPSLTQETGPPQSRLPRRFNTVFECHMYHYMVWFIVYEYW